MILAQHLTCGLLVLLLMESITSCGTSCEHLSMFKCFITRAFRRGTFSRLSKITIDAVANQSGREMNKSRDNVEWREIGSPVSSRIVIVVPRFPRMISCLLLLIPVYNYTVDSQFPILISIVKVCADFLVIDFQCYDAVNAHCWRFYIRGDVKAESLFSWEMRKFRPCPPLFERLEGLVSCPRLIFEHLAQFHQDRISQLL